MSAQAQSDDIRPSAVDMTAVHASADQLAAAIQLHKEAKRQLHVAATALRLAREKFTTTERAVKEAQQALDVAFEAALPQ